MRIAIIGAGNVGKTLGRRLRAKGHAVRPPPRVRGATSPSSWRGVKMPRTTSRELGQSILRERSDRAMLQRRPVIVS
ncbi:MAG TPA: hypothetical protein DCL72_09210 [Rhizobiales bacterium]|nr:hypothetical protein [Hyphomicrobiales bacterium]